MRQPQRGRQALVAAPKVQFLNLYIVNIEVALDSLTSRYADDAKTGNLAPTDQGRQSRQEFCCMSAEADKG